LGTFPLGGFPGAREGVSALDLPFGLAALAFGLPASGALSAFFTAFPLSALAGTALAGTALAGPDLGDAAAPRVTGVPFALAVVAFAAVPFAAGVFAAAVPGAAGFVGSAAMDLAASFSDVTAVSRALVAAVIAVSALVSVFAEVTAFAAAAFSLVEAEVTLVAAADTAPGITAAARALPGVFAAAGFAAPVPFVALAGRVARAADPVRTEFAVRTGAALAAAFLVGGTDLPPIWIS
jgi:hypothetical protein